MTLCFLFDKIHFPRVYLPMGDYDKELLEGEIERLIALNDKSYDTQHLINILRFLEYRLPLDGILEYPTAGDAIFGNDDKQLSSLVGAIYRATYPPRPNFHPTFRPSFTKALPGSGREEITYAGEFYYQAGAIAYAAEHQLPLLDDGSFLPLPFRAQYKDNAGSLSALLALESVSLVLPELPLMTPQELVDFRVENVKELRNFRASMLRYAKVLNNLIAEDASDESVQRKTKFLVETEIAPAVHDLERDLNNPNRPWRKRMADTVKVVSSVIPGLLTGGLVGQTAAEGIRNAALSELEARGDKQEAAKRDGLYYLLKARAKRP